LKENQEKFAKKKEIGGHSWRKSYANYALEGKILWGKPRQSL
jgi:hypothetical protein